MFCFLRGGRDGRKFADKWTHAVQTNVQESIVYVKSGINQPMERVCQARIKIYEWLEARIHNSKTASTSETFVRGFDDSP